jgi:type III pantothenate kinase
MLLAIDIGNTMISLGVIRQKRIIRTFFVERNMPLPQFKRELSRIFCLIHKKYTLKQGVWICSVVPSMLAVVRTLVWKELCVKPSVVGEDFKVPMVNRYRNPRQVGQDRLVGAFAARTLYGVPVMIIDFGTAITFDVVSKSGAYEGGMIVPGIRLTAESLFQKTAMLPRIEIIKPPKNLIGKTTQESILSGIFYGYGALCQGIIDKISRRQKQALQVVITGGYGSLMRQFIDSKIQKVDPDLVFKGLQLICDYYRK